MPEPHPLTISVQNTLKEPGDEYVLTSELRAAERLNAQRVQQAVHRLRMSGHRIRRIDLGNGALVYRMEAKNTTAPDGSMGYRPKPKPKPKQKQKAVSPKPEKKAQHPELGTTLTVTGLGLDPDTKEITMILTNGTRNWIVGVTK